MGLLVALMLAGCGSGGSGQSSAPDDHFSNLTWTGTAIEFTAKQEITLTGITVFVGSEEFEGKYVSNSEGNMGFSNGTTLTPGSQIGFHGGLIIFEGTTASCAIDIGGATADKVVFTLEDGSTLERAL